MEQNNLPERQSLEVDIACVGFGPAMGGFLNTLSKKLLKEDGSAALESSSMPGMPLQLICYERADDIGFGVSGIVTRGKGIKESFPELADSGNDTLSQIPMAARVAEEKLVYLLDPIGASRRSFIHRCGDVCINALKGILPCEHHALTLPFIPGFLQKEDGFLFSMGQFNQWVGSQLIGSGLVQIWPGMPVAKALIDKEEVVGVRLLDQGTDKIGAPTDGFMPGMDIRAALTVIGDGPVGAVGKQLEEHYGLPEGNHQREWAVGAKMVVELPAETTLKPGTVFHTFGYPEPEIFGFMYVYPGNLASLGIFVPSTFRSPVRTSYRYLQHWMQHPYIWRYLEGGVLRSWGAKSLQESGKLGEPYLAGDGYARIGEGSGSTNILTGSGVDEAWTTGVQLAEAVLELAQAKKSFSKENLEAAYVTRRRQSWVEKEGLVAEKARAGFHYGMIPGLLGMGLTGLSRGLLSLPAKSAPPHKMFQDVKKFYKGKISASEIEAIETDCRKHSQPLHDALMDRAGWPAVPFDGSLLVSQQDALLLGGKVQAAPGFADHVEFIHPELCESCGVQVCVEACSGQAITAGESGSTPDFDREKCVHCGACIWNCSKALPENPEKSNILFKSGSGGLHSSEN